ncbi:MAG TPA: glycosyltransferase family 2 protein [Chloroflexia bacterium]|nr:glycosyltransferase family 2 protein [Chloroflexia bacterium]
MDLPVATVSILVLNWNGQKFLEPCLRSLQAQTFRDFEVILVDNGSTDGSSAFVRETFAGWLTQQELPRLRLLELNENSGFSGGNNHALAVVDPRTPFIATLNNDTLAEPEWLATLVAALQEREKGWGAACGPMLFSSVQAKAQPVIASAGIEIRRDGLALDRHVGQPLQSGSEPEEIFGPCAGAALYRYEVIEKVGFFDEAFFAYLEDADLAWRMRLAGYRTLFLPNALVWHEYSGTGKQGSPFKNYQLGRNRLWVILKDWPSALLWRHALAIIFYDLAASAYTLLRGNTHSLRGRLAALQPRHLRRLIKQRRAIQRERVVTPVELEAWLQPSATPLETLRLRKTTDKLVNLPS